MKPGDLMRLSEKHRGGIRVWKTHLTSDSAMMGLAEPGCTCLVLESQETCTLVLLSGDSPRVGWIYGAFLAPA